jgi:hypothetical protein
MQNPEHTEPTRRLRNAFSAEFLERFPMEDEPSSSGEADAEGPWRVLPWPTPDGREAYGLWRLGEEPEAGDPPAAVFRERSSAMLAAIARPALGRDPFFRLGKERDQAGGFPLLRQGEAEGWLDLFDQDWAFGVGLLERLVRSPEALATVLEAAGSLALLRAGAILLTRTSVSRN